jgi:ADP-heptose:LPS heptosyltransferase
MPEEAKFTADYLGKLSILETARVISQLDLLITTDTGLMHIANILGVPLIAMFGPTLTTKNAPGGERSWVLISGMGCAPCQDNSKFHNCKAPVCMQSIGVGDVMSLTKMILGG